MHGARLRIHLTLALALATAVGCGQHEGPGEIRGGRLPDTAIAGREHRAAEGAAWLAGRAGTRRPDKQILFGDLHVHTTFSADAFMMSLPIMQGEGAHPIADACDFARHCSGLDFWSINDHAEGLTPRRWRETKESVRQCNELAGDPSNPDLVTFLGWEWTQIGRTREDHWGHKNVIFRDTADDAVPARPIHSASFTTRTMRQRPPFLVRWAPIFLDWPNRQRYRNFATFQDELRDVDDCADGVNTRELPEECLEGAATPRILYRKLGEWGFPALVIPHGTTWGLYTPAGATWDKQLTRAQHDPKLQTLVEVFSGHGNSEEHRTWRAAHTDHNDELLCPEPSEGYEPCCWRAGELIRARCDDPESEECVARARAARVNFLEAGSAGRLTVPGTTVADWGNCSSCPDCFLPSMNYRPGNSVQYMLARSGFEKARDPLRFSPGFIASSDNHRARPGTGYKEYARLANTEASGARSETWRRRILDPQPATPESLTAEQVIERTQQQPYLRLDFERQASFFMTGGLVATHATGRSRTEIWDALERREVYGTSGPRILLWFDLLNARDGPAPMGSRVAMTVQPRFRVRAAGALVQAPGCSATSRDGLSAERLEALCRGECYSPTDERERIARIEVVRIQRQASPDEPIHSLIEDPWRTFECPETPDGCMVEFGDPDWRSLDREVVYYVRAVQPASPVVNGGGLRCVADGTDACARVEPCYGDYRTPPDDDCLTPAEERAWSSPIYVRPAA